MTQKKTITVELSWDVPDLGPMWMNPDNLELLLYTEAYTTRDLLGMKIVGVSEVSQSALAQHLQKRLDEGRDKRKVGGFVGAKDFSPVP